MIKVNLPNGKETIIDESDLDLVKANVYTRFSHGVWYVEKSLLLPGGHIGLHRLILGRKIGRKLESFEYVDHINGNGLDNRRSNLRISSNRENRCNSKKYKLVRGRPPTSIYKGVYLDKTRKCWVAKIKVNQKNLHLGRFKNETEAAKVYDTAAKIAFGEFARLNFPDS